MTVDRSGLSRRVNRDDYALAEFGAPKPNPYLAADQGSLTNVARQPARRPVPMSTPSGVPLRQLTEPTYEQKLELALADYGAGRNTVFSDWFEGNLPGGKYTTEGQPETYGTRPTRPLPSKGYSGGGAGGLDPVAFAKAINDYIASVDEGRTDFDTLQADLAGRFAGYGENIASAADAATARQEASAARAAEALAAIDPQAAFQFNVDPASMGSGAALGYLESIGASTAGVEGLRDFEQSLLNQQLAGARQFSEAQQSALDIERAARQAAVPQILQETQGALEANRLAATLGLSEEERRALEALLTRESAEEQSIADRILEARLAAAEAGVTL